MVFNSNVKTLVVDDNATMRRIMVKLLGSIGIENVETAENGEQGLEALEKGDFALVISDWMMAPMSGLELLKAVRKSPKLRNITFVIVTSEHKTDIVIEAREAGVSNYLVKPFNAETLKTRIMEAFEYSRSDK